MGPPQRQPYPPAESSPRLDLLVVGGEVVDPASGRRGAYDIGARDGRIAAVAASLPRELASQVVDARGCLVLPGLVDLHTHILAGATYWGIDPRPLAWRSGVTTWVDAGSAGAYNASAFRQLCASYAPLRSKAFLNISLIGLVAETGEARRGELCDPGLCAAVLQEHKELFVGVKCRVDRNAVGDMGLEPLRRALRAASVAGVPVMAHIGAGPPAIGEVLELLRPGDIVTHCATGQSMSVLAPDGRPLPAALAARERGVLFDVGHGSGAFSFMVAEAMARFGFFPDIISSDAHQRSILGPGFDLPTCMSKVLALGMSLEDVVRAVTARPSGVIKEADAGALEVGHAADFALFELQEGDFDLFDVYLEPRRCQRLFVNRATFASGTLLAPVPPSPPAPWVALTASQRALFSRPPEELQRPWATLLTTADCFVPQDLEGPVVGGTRSTPLET